MPDSTPAVQTTYMRSVNESLSPEMKTFYSKDLLEQMGPQLIHMQFGDKVSIPRNGGRMIEWRKFSNFSKALTPLTEGVTPAPEKLKVFYKTQTLEEFGAFTVLTDILDMTAIDNNIVEVTSKHADNASLTLDTIVKNELATTPNYIYAKGTSIQNIDNTAVLTRNSIAQAMTFLKKMNAPKFDGSYVALIHPSVSYDIMTSADWIDIQKYSNATKIFDGEIGKLYGVRFVESSEALVRKNDAGKSVYHCFFLGKGAYKVIDVGGAGVEIIVKNRESGGTSDPLNQRSTVGWKIPMFGAKLTMPEYCVCVACGSSLGDNDAANDVSVPDTTTQESFGAGNKTYDPEPNT